MAIDVRLCVIATESMYTFPPEHTGSSAYYTTKDIPGGSKHVEGVELEAYPSRQTGHQLGRCLSTR